MQLQRDAPFTLKQKPAVKSSKDNVMPRAPLNVRLAVLWIVFLALPYFAFSNYTMWLLGRFSFDTAFLICLIVAIFITVIKWDLMWLVINGWKIFLFGFLFVVAIYLIFPPSSEEYIVGMQLTSETARLHEAEIAAFMLWYSIFSVSYIITWLSQLKQEKTSGKAVV